MNGEKPNANATDISTDKTDMATYGSLVTRVRDHFHGQNAFETAPQRSATQLNSTQPGYEFVTRPTPGMPPGSQHIWAQAPSINGNLVFELIIISKDSLCKSLM